MIHLRVALFIVFLSLHPNTWAARVLIVHGTGPQQQGHAQMVQSALPSTDTVELRTSVPDAGTLATFDHAWDLRGLSIGVGLSNDEIFRYVNYLALGKSLVALGEHNLLCGTDTQCFKPRNDSLLKLIEDAGGGRLNYAEAASTQTVQAPFTGPNAVVTVQYGSVSAVATSGTGQFITKDPTIGAGSALAFRGTLANAVAGTLIVVFDVNWLDIPQPPDFANLLRNIVSYLPTPPPVATVSSILAGVGRPYGMAIYGGFAYIADPQSHTVWKVDLANPGQKTAVAGIGWKTDVDPQDWQGYNGDGIESTEAQLDNPSGVAVDADGNLYIADTGNHAVRRIAAGASFITTVAGIPTSFAVGENTRLFAPRAVAVDQAGNVYVADMMNQQVKRLDKTTGALSVVSGVAGRPGSNNGPAAGPEFCPPFEPAGCTAAARLNSPIGVAVDSEGIVYIADEGNNRTRKVTLGGNVSTLLASGLLKPTAIAVTPDGGTAYIADYGNHRVLRAQCNSDGCSVTTIAGTGTPGSAANPGPATAVQLNSPMGVTLDGNFLYIADMMNGRVVVINLTPVP